MQELQQEWPLSHGRLELSQAAAWNTRTQHLYTVAAVRPEAAQVPEKASQQRLLGWPTSYTGALEDAPISMEMHSAVHAVHPIFASVGAASVKDIASEQTHSGVAAEEQHNSSSATERASTQSAFASQKQKVSKCQSRTKTPALLCNLSLCGGGEHSC